MYIIIDISFSIIEVLISISTEVCFDRDKEIKQEYSLVSEGYTNLKEICETRQ